MSKKLVIEVHELGSINPNKLKGWFFPNWYEKEHFEEFLDKEMTDEEFEKFKTYLVDETRIHDEISTTMGEYVREFWEEFKKSK